MLPRSKDQVLPQNTVPPECPPQVLSQFADSPPSNLASLSPHQSLPSPHLPLPAHRPAYFSFSSPPQPHSPGPHFYSSDANFDFFPLPFASSLQSSPTFFHQNYPCLPWRHSSPPLIYQLGASPPLSHRSSLSQGQNSSPHSCQSPPHLRGIHSSTATPPSPSPPSGGISSNKQTWQCPQSKNTRSPVVAGGCKASKVDPAEFKDPMALAQALVVRVGHRRIATDLQLLFLQRLWLGTSTPGQAPVVEYPICLQCLQPRTPSCPTPKYKKGARLLAFPQLLPCAQGQESGPLRIGIGFGLHLSLGQAKALHLLPPKKRQEASPQGKVVLRQPPTTQTPETQVIDTLSQARPLKFAGLQSLKSSQCSVPPAQAPRWVTASPRPRLSTAPKRSVSPESILEKLPS
ncbi:proline-rich protein 30 [Microtus ochrogaster]|uniref:Proline-rich protein 30 n=1 Tax=Microtus ochrogaster TaxID=79684 RepID=A0ABM0LRL6_MICOH|nr:proline-rich protein 30 [Microtus ochrogaster]